MVERYVRASLLALESPTFNFCAPIALSRLAVPVHGESVLARIVATGAIYVVAFLNQRAIAAADATVDPIRWGELGYAPLLATVLFSYSFPYFTSRPAPRARPALTAVLLSVVLAAAVHFYPLEVTTNSHEKADQYLARFPIQLPRRVRSFDARRFEGWLRGASPRRW